MERDDSSTTRGPKRAPAKEYRPPTGQPTLILLNKPRPKSKAERANHAPQTVWCWWLPPSAPGIVRYSHSEPTNKKLDTTFGSPNGQTGPDGNGRLWETLAPAASELLEAMGSVVPQKRNGASYFRHQREDGEWRPFNYEDAKRNRKRKTPGNSPAKLPVAADSMDTSDASGQQKDNDNDDDDDDDEDEDDDFGREQQQQITKKRKINDNIDIWEEFEEIQAPIRPAQPFKLEPQPDLPRVAPAVLQAKPKVNANNANGNMVKVDPQHNAEIRKQLEEIVANADGQAAADEVSRLLRSARHLNLQEQDCTRRTLLEVAAESGKIMIAKQLIKAGAKFANDISRVGCDSWLLGMRALVHALNDDDFFEFIDAKMPIAQLLQADKELFFQAAARGCVPLIQAFLKAGAHKDDTDEKGSTALHIATIHAHAEAINALLKAGADINATDATGRTALHIAAENGMLGIVKVLLFHKLNLEATCGDDKYTALDLAAKSGHNKIVELLFMSGVDIHGDIVPPLILAAEKGHLDVVKFLLKSTVDINTTVSGSEETALSAAVRGNHSEVVKELLAGKANVTAKCHAALRDSITNGYVDVPKQLFAAGAAHEYNHPETGKVHYLELAAESGNVEVVKALCGAEIAYSAEIINAALRNAIVGRHAPVVQVLQRVPGANLNMALEEAARVDDLEIARLLLHAGASPGSKGVLGLFLASGAFSVAKSDAMKKLLNGK